MKITLSLIKADVGSIGGHTKPTDEMLAKAHDLASKGKESKLLLDAFVFHSGDDIVFLMSHTKGPDNCDIHTFAWDAFVTISHIAHASGCYGAGQDLLVDAPSGNVRGAGPGVAEIEFELLNTDYRTAESFLVLAADKCGPGAFNLPLFLSFADPMYCAGLMLPKMIQGFTFEIVDMNDGENDRSIILEAPEDYYTISMLLRDNERFGIYSIHSRTYDEHVVSISTDRLHTIAGKYTGKDDPVALVRNQGIFPAPEEILMPFTKAHYIGGDSRGSHTMPLMPVPMNTAVTGAYCLPVVACIGFSVNNKGLFSQTLVDFFDNPAWDAVRLKAQEKAFEMRSQGWSGPAMLPYSELEYSGFRETLENAEKQFVKRTRKRCKRE